MNTQGLPHVFLLICLGLGVVGCTAPLLAVEAYLCTRCPAPKYLDGQLKEWEEPAFTIEDKSWRTEDGCRAIYGGEHDCSASVRLAWDPQYLYCAISLQDDYFCPVKEGPIELGDAILLRLAPADAADPAARTPVECIFTLAGTAQVFTRDRDGKLVKADGIKLGAARNVVAAPKTSMPREDGKAPSPTLTHVWYELAIPWQALPHLTPAAGASFGLEMQCLDADGQGLRGRLRWRGLHGVPRTATDLGWVRLAPSPPTTAPRR